jgi:hypothetical protein
MCSSGQSICSWDQNIRKEHLFIGRTFELSSCSMAIILTEHLLILIPFELMNYLCGHAMNRAAVHLVAIFS